MSVSSTIWQRPTDPSTSPTDPNRAPPPTSSGPSADRTARGTLAKGTSVAGDRAAAAHDVRYSILTYFHWFRTLQVSEFKGWVFTRNLLKLLSSLTTFHLPISSFFLLNIHYLAQILFGLNSILNYLDSWSPVRTPLFANSTRRNRQGAVGTLGIKGFHF